MFDSIDVVQGLEVVLHHVDADHRFEDDDIRLVLDSVVDLVHQEQDHFV
jgi:hypothetical protein